MIQTDEKSQIIIIHGFGGNVKQDFIVKLQAELSKNKDLKIAIRTVTWDTHYPNYFKAQSAAKEHGKELAEKIKNLGLTNIHCIGFSLGAQICGHIGKNIKLKRITGLDPAGPGYEYLPITEKLHVLDAEFIDIIHTNSLLSFSSPIGDVDFYLHRGGLFQDNGGLFQDNCINSEIDWDYEFLSLGKIVNNVLQLNECSHRRSIDYFIESINSNCKFKGFKAESYSKFLKGELLTKDYQCMGYHVNNTIRGLFFL